MRGALHSITATSDGGFILAGTSAPSAGGTHHFWILKLDGNGNIEWQKMFGGEYTELMPYIQQTTDNGYVLAGRTSSFGADSEDIWVLRLSSSGGIVWQKVYGDSRRDIPSDIQQTADGGFIVAGRSNSFGDGDYDIWVLKLTSSGNVSWEQTYGEDEDDQAYAIRQTDDGGYIMAGRTSSFGFGDSDAWIIKLDETGDIEWERTYGGTNYDAAWDIHSLPDGGFAAVGITRSFGSGNSDILFLKLDEDGRIPNCSVMATSHADVTATNASGRNTNGSATNTSVSGKAVSARSTNRSESVTSVCGASAGTLTGPIGFSSTQSQTVDLPLNGPEVNVAVWGTDGHGWSDMGNFNQATGQYTLTGIPSQATTITIELEVWYDDHILVDNENPFCDLPDGGVVRRNARVDFPNVSVSSGFYPLVLKNPVALIHGIAFFDVFGGCYNKWDSWADDLRLNRDPDQPDHPCTGFITFQPNHHFHTGINGNSGEEIQVQAAADVSLQLRTDFNGLTSASSSVKRPVDLICHSEGGVAARVFKTFQSWHVGKIFTLGTPHSGTDALSADGYGLDRAYMTDVFNQAYPNFGATNVYAVAGHAFGCYSASDEIVFWDWEGSLPAFFILKNVGGTLITEKEFQGYYDWEPGVSDPHNFCYPHWDLGGYPSRSDILENTILPILRGNAPMFVGRESVSETSAPMTGASLVSVSSDKIALGAGSGQIMEAPIGPTDVATFQSTLLAGQGAFRVIDPGATEIDPSTIQSYAGATYLEGVDGQRYSIRNPKPGLWTIVFSANSTGATGSLGAQENSLWNLSGSADFLQYAPGGDLVLKAYITGVSPGVSSVTVTAVISNESGQAIGHIPLLDDGLNGDGSASDGIYGYGGPAPLIPGLYRITYSLRGVADGHTVARETQAGFVVLAQAPILSGGFSDQPLDEDEDGAYDHIIMTAELNVPVQGTYTVWGDLYDGEGYAVSHAVGYWEAGAEGAGSVELDFEVLDLGCQQFASPLRVRNLTVSGPNTLSPWHVWASPVDTQAYDGAFFGCSETQQPSPSIISLSPSVAFPGESIDAILSGSGFLDGVQVTSSGSGVVFSNIRLLGDKALTLNYAVDQVASVGGRDVTVTNLDGKTATATSLLTVAADRPPSVRLTYPADGATVVGPVTVSASAADDRGIEKVEFLVDGTVAWSADRFPYQFAWDTVRFANGDHTLIARATDSSYFVAESSITVNVGNIIIPGDCDYDGVVSIGEVQKAINMFLGSIPPDCGVDCNGNGTVSIGEVQKVINVFLGLASRC